MSRLFLFLSCLFIGCLLPLLAAELAAGFPVPLPRSLWLAVFLAALALGAYLAKRRCTATDHPLSHAGLWSLALGALALLLPFAVTWLTSTPIAVRLAPAPQHADYVRMAAALLMAVPPGMSTGAIFPFAAQGFARRLGNLGSAALMLQFALLTGVFIGLSLLGPLRETQLSRLLGVTTSAAALVVMGTVTWLLSRREPIILFGAASGGDLAARGFSRFILPPRLIRRIALLLGVVAAGAVGVLWQHAAPRAETVAMLWTLTGCTLLGTSVSLALVRLKSGLLGILVLLLCAAGLFMGVAAGLVTDARGPAAGRAAAFVPLTIAASFVIRLMEPFARSAGIAVGELLGAAVLGAAISVPVTCRWIIPLLGPWPSLCLLGGVCALAALLTLRFIAEYRSALTLATLAALAFNAWQFIRVQS